MRLFSDEWFEAYQKPLLFLANTKHGRKALGIYETTPRDRSVVAVRPNGVTWLEERHPTFLHALWSMRTERERTFTADFRSRDKIRNRLIYGALPKWEKWAGYVNQVWRPLTVQPAFALEATFRPDPHPETTTVDGYIYRSATNETFATIRGGAGSVASDTSLYFYAVQLTSGSATDTFNLMLRGVCLFDTSSLGASAIISAATLSIKGLGKDNPLGGQSAVIVSSSPASNTAVVAGDYQSFGSVAFFTFTYAAWSTTAYNDGALNAAGIANISKTGVSKFGTRGEWDINNAFGGTWVSGVNDSIYGASADTAGTISDPKLVVTYTLGGPAMMASLF